MTITAFDGAGVTVWGCFSLNCKLDLYVIDGTLTGQKYRHQSLCSLVVPHFDCPYQSVLRVLLPFLYQNSLQFLKY
jgi:hypothetical protein